MLLDVCLDYGMFGSNFLYCFCTCVESIFYCCDVRSSKANDLPGNMMYDCEIRSGKTKDLSGNMISGGDVRSASYQSHLLEHDVLL